MSQPSIKTTGIRLILPESIWLEPEHFYQATQISNRIMNETQQWQTYLNSLGLFGFEEWLTARLPEQPIQKQTHVIETCAQLQLGEFKFCVISTEHLLDEVVSIPSGTIHHPELVAHFYVVLEVSEEQEEVIIRGCLRYDQLVTYCSSDRLQDGSYQLPLSVFDLEPNHLLHYYLYLEPSSIPLPVTSTEKVSENLLTYFKETRIKLSQWFQGVCDEGWEVIDNLLERETNLAFNTRHILSGIKRAKLIDLGVQLGNQTVALLVNISEESEEKLGVLIQLHPTNGERVLPSNIKLTLFSKAGKTLQEVTARSQDNYIQLKPFKGEPGKRFSLEVSLEDARVREYFEL
ncbi:hypothetical protein WA1_20645 [Scytonema hofmannii PCC 7110]|uniref:DUF1822 domain-containing protein n=1 Tax=Scytonema hofmannii PCC 7110 TaxID=128403 RepID=A0A139XCF8_9CYAN|nr:DUF1822 family protein [Scytonema hofmannii]KYC42380.1 hypothetical protein WA1_20645 [Scytonema hofmannii PCC 7110]